MSMQLLCFYLTRVLMVLSPLLLPRSPDTSPAPVRQDNSVYLLRAVSLGLVIFCNVLQWQQFTRALNRAPSTIHAGLINSAANFIGTAVFAKVFFGDALPPMWFAGVGFIFLGMSLMNSGTKKEGKRAIVKVSRNRRAKNPYILDKDG